MIERYGFSWFESLHAGVKVLQKMIQSGRTPGYTDTEGLRTAQQRVGIKSEQEWEREWGKERLWAKTGSGTRGNTGSWFSKDRVTCHLHSYW